MSESASLTVFGRYANIRELCAFVTKQAQAAGLDEKALFHVELCCDEAATNIIEHAYAGEGKGAITVTTSINNDAFVIQLHDHGRSFDPDSVPSPTPPGDGEPLSAETIERLKVGGLGIHFMRKLMDEVQFQFNTETGNILTLIKQLPQGSDA